MHSPDIRRSHSETGLLAGDPPPVRPVNVEKADVNWAADSAWILGGCPGEDSIHRVEDPLLVITVESDSTTVYLSSPGSTIVKAVIRSLFRRHFKFRVLRERELHGPDLGPTAQPH